MCSDSERLARVIEWLEPRDSLPAPDPDPDLFQLSPLGLWHSFGGSDGKPAEWQQAASEFRALLVAAHRRGIEFAVTARAVVLCDRDRSFGSYARIPHTCGSEDEIFEALLAALDEYREFDDAE